MGWILVAGTSIYPIYPGARIAEWCVIFWIITEQFEGNIVVYLKKVKGTIEACIKKWMGCGWKYNFIIGSFKRERKCRVNRKMDNLRGVGFEIDFIFNIDGVYVRKIWVIFFFMSCEWESVNTRFVGSVKCKRHIFNVKSFNVFFKEGVPRMLYLIFATAKGITRAQMVHIGIEDGCVNLNGIYYDNDHFVV